MMHGDAHDRRFDAIARRFRAPASRASRNEGYTAASNAARDSAQSSTAQQFGAIVEHPPHAAARQRAPELCAAGAAAPPCRRAARARAIVPRTARRDRPAPRTRGPRRFLRRRASTRPRETRGSARAASRARAGGMWCSRTHGGLPTTRSKPSRAAASAKCTGNENGKRRAGRERGDPAPQVARSQAQIVQRRRALHRRRDRRAANRSRERTAQIRSRRSPRDRLAFAHGHRDRDAALLAVERARERPLARAGGARVSARAAVRAPPARRSRTRRRTPGRPARRRRECAGRGSAAARTASGSRSSASMTTESQSRSSHSQTAVGFTSTPKIERVSTSRRRSPTGRSSPAARARSASRSSRCTRNAPEPHAGSSTRTFASAARSGSRSAGGERVPLRARGRTSAGGTPTRLSAASRPSPPTRLDDRARRIERAGGPPVAGGHERLERATEHFGIDRGLAPRRRTLARRHAIPGEQRRRSARRAPRR